MKNYINKLKLYKRDLYKNSYVNLSVMGINDEYEVKFQAVLMMLTIHIYGGNHGDVYEFLDRINIKMDEVFVSLFIL